MGQFKKQRGMFSDLRNLTEALDPEQQSSMTNAPTNPAEVAGLTGTVDPGLLQNGLLARDLVIRVEKTGTSVGSRHEPRPVCRFKVEVTLDNTPSYLGNSDSRCPWPTCRSTSLARR
jgi:hypothetical protein